QHRMMNALVYYLYMRRRSSGRTLFPYTTLFRSRVVRADVDDRDLVRRVDVVRPVPGNDLLALPRHGEASLEAAEGGSQIGRRVDPADVHVDDRVSTRGRRDDVARRREVGVWVLDPPEARLAHHPAHGERAVQARDLHAGTGIGRGEVCD